MEGVLTAKSEEKKQASKPASDSFSESGELGAAAGLPLFLGGGVQRKLAAGASEDAGLQLKCDCGGSSSGECEECRKKREQESQSDHPVQKKCSACEDEEERVQHKQAVAAQLASIHGAARAGVASASQPLPHLDRIQSSFGRHDVTSARTETGGPAAHANASMGALAYTAGDRIAFRREPDLKLAAHEAAHVVQQRSGAKLPGGVGRPGDAYERQADAVAESVDRGESAELILDRTISSDPSASETVVQHALEVTATREFELPVVSPGDLGGDREPLRAARAPAAGPKGAPKGDQKAGDQSGAEDEGSVQGSGKPDTKGSARGGGGAVPQQGQAAQPSPQAAAQGGSSAAQPASTAQGGAQAAQATNIPSGGRSQTKGGNQAACAGGATPRCYKGASPKPDPEPDEKPPNPPPADVKAETSAGDEPDLPEPDDCPAHEAKAGVSGAAPGAATPASTAAPVAAGPSPSAAPTSGGAQASQASGDIGPASSAARPGPAGATGGGGAPPPASEPQVPVQSVGSPLEGAIALSEAQRGAAVSGFAASSAGLTAASDGAQALRSGVRFAPSANGEDARRGEVAAARAEAFFAAAADRLDQAIASASEQVPDRLGEQAETGKAQIASSIEAQKNAISASVERARGQARVDAAVARRAVSSQASSFISTVQADTARAIETLTATHASTTEQVNGLETSTLEKVNQIYAEGRTKLAGLGTTVGNECTATGERFATVYEGFEHCTENGFWDGDLSERRAYAQAKAARKTAKGFHDRMVDAAKKRASEVTKAGRKENRCAVIATARQARETLDQHLANLTTALQAARDGAIQQAGITRDSLIASIDNGFISTLRQLDQAEHDQRQAADDTGYMQQVMQEQLAHAGTAALQRAVAGSATTLQATLFELQSKFAASNTPDLPTLDQAMTTVTQRIDAAMNGLGGGIGSGAALVQQQLAGAAAAGLAALDGVTQSSDEMVGTLSGGFSSSMGALTGADNFAPQRAGFSQMIQQTASGGNTALVEALSRMRKGCDSITTDSNKALKQAATDLEKNLRESQQGLECQITQAADQAASEEPPAWKMLVAILLVILVIVIIIAVTILTAGMALGPLALIGLGALVGGLTAGLIALASNLWNNRPTWQGVFKAVLIGAITGAIGGAAGAGAGALFKGSSLVVQYGAAMVTSGLLDVGGQFVLGGLSFKNFSWTNLGMTLIITALTLGLAHGVAQARAPQAPTTTEPPSATVEPTARPSEPVPTAAEPTAPPSAPAPEAAGAPPKPAAATPETPPTAPPSAPAPEAAAAPPKPAEAPKPAEPSGPAEPPGPAEPSPAEPVEEKPAGPEETEPEPGEDLPKEERIKPPQRSGGKQKLDSWLKDEGLSPKESKEFKRWLEKGHDIGEPHEHLRPYSDEAKARLQEWLGETGRTPSATEAPAPGPAAEPPAPERMGTVSAGPEGIVEHPTSTPTVEQAPPQRGGAPRPAAATATPDVSEPTAGQAPPRRGFTSEEILEHTSEAAGMKEVPELARVPETSDVRENPNLGSREMGVVDRPSTTLRNAMDAEGRPVPPGHDAHHIVPREGGGEAGARCRAVLEKAGVGLDEGANGVALPRTTLNPEVIPEAATRHGPVHTRDYFETLAELLEETPPENVRDALRKMGQVLIDASR